MPEGGLIVSLSEDEVRDEETDEGKEGKEVRQDSHQEDDLCPPDLRAQLRHRQGGRNRLRPRRLEENPPEDAHENNDDQEHHEHGAQDELPRVQVGKAVAAGEPLSDKISHTAEGQGGEDDDQAGPALAQEAEERVQWAEEREAGVVEGSGGRVERPFLLANLAGGGIRIRVAR